MLRGGVCPWEEEVAGIVIFESLSSLAQSWNEVPVGGRPPGRLKFKTSTEMSHVDHPPPIHVPAPEVTLAKHKPQGQPCGLGTSRSSLWQDFGPATVSNGYEKESLKISLQSCMSSGRKKVQRIQLPQGPWPSFFSRLKMLRERTSCNI